MRRIPLVELDVKLPRENCICDDYLCPTEVHTRMTAVLHSIRLFDLHSLDWDAKFESIGIDSLESCAVITSFEHEFHTVFEDRVFENFENLN